MGMMVMMMLLMGVMELMGHHIVEFLINMLAVFRCSSSNVRIRR